MSIAMTRDEREAFLADVHVGIVTVDTAEGPLSSPVWYAYEPGADITFVTPAASRKAQAIDVGSMVAFCAQDESLPPKYVSVQAEVSAITPADPGRDVTPMAVRYLGDELGAAYVESTRADGEIDEVLVALTPRRWFSADFMKRLG